LARLGQHLESLTRLLDGLSYRGVLERGFVLVRGEGGGVRRRAAAVVPGEALILSFADGDVQAGTVGPAPQAEKKPGKKPGPGSGPGRDADQGSLF
jgi:exodeoxyribonuclease VII large subunit